MMLTIDPANLPIESSTQSSNVVQIVPVRKKNVHSDVRKVVQHKPIFCNEIPGIMGCGENIKSDEEDTPSASTQEPLSPQQQMTPVQDPILRRNGNSSSSQSRTSKLFTIKILIIKKIQNASLPTNLTHSGTVKNPRKERIGIQLENARLGFQELCGNHTTAMQVNRTLILKLNVMSNKDF